MPPTPEDDPSTLEQRVIELEIKASYADDLLDHLNAQVAAQHGQIDWLRREIAALRQQAAGGDAGTAPTLREELPPHY